MKFGVLYDFRNPSVSDWHVPWSEFYGATFEHMEEIERIGFDAISLCEHHGDPDGYNPGLPATMAIAASRTKTIRIGSNIIQVPFYHPVLLAEQLAVIDVISGGRLDVGLGQVGPTFDMEFPMFGINPRQRPSRLDEGLDVMIRAWSSDEPFSYHGKRWDLDDIWLNPRPMQDPLPVWVVAAYSEKAMDRVAGRGLDVGGLGGFFLGATGGAAWKEWLGGWHAACDRAGRPRDYASIHTWGTCYVTDDPEKAWAEHREGLFHAFHYARAGMHPYSSLMMDEVPQVPEDMPGWENLFQTPEQAVAQLQSDFADGAPSELHLMAHKPGMSFEQSAHYLRNFAEKVIPAVADL